MFKLGRFRIDLWLTLPTLVLLIIGLLLLQSLRELGSQYTEPNFNIIVQLVAVVAGSAAFAAISATPLRKISHYSLAVYIAAVVLLVAVLTLPGVNGSQRWLDIGPFKLQASEVAKLGIVLFLSKYFSSVYTTIRNSVPRVLVSVLIIGVPIVLTLLEPDLGTALLLVALWFLMLLFTTVRPLFLSVLLLLVMACVPVAYGSLAEYQRERVQTFLQPANDPQGSGYNVAQAMITLGSGGLTGNGLEAGTQSQLRFLPAQHTDFIFSVLGEKLGFIGVAVVLVAFTTLFVRMVVLATAARDRYGMFICIGVLGVMGFQTIINTGMNTGMLPVTGIPLPFMSYGGSHILFGMILLGLVHRVSIESNNRGSESLQI